MNKLELKHLAPYLPYEIRVKNFIDNKIFIFNQVRGKKFIGYDDNFEGISFIEDCKPILRPLSDLTKLIDKKELECTFFDWILSEYDVHVVKFIKSLGIERVPYEVIEYLLEWHFDVFGLIPKGLAIDINTI